MGGGAFPAGGRGGLGSSNMRKGGPFLNGVTIFPTGGGGMRFSRLKIRGRDGKGCRAVK